MPTEASKFNFSNEVTEFAKTLGELTPNQCGRVPELGDTIDMNVDFRGVNISSGIIVKFFDFDLSDQPDIMEAFENFEILDDIQLDYLSNLFNYVDPDVTGSYVRGCVASFSTAVGAVEAESKLIGSDGYATDGTITNGLMKAKLYKSKDGSYLLKGRLKCCIGAEAIISTKEVDDFKKMHATQSTVESVAWSDKILPPRLLEKFNDELDQFCRQEPADYHPGSGTVVRDIVHPSLYCYVDGVSRLKSSQDIELANSLANREDSVDVWGRPYEQSMFQWLPSEFNVSENGKVRINSYINNLDRVKYPGIYSCLERMFENILPMFEAVCGALRNDFYGATCGEMPDQISLRNRTLQIIPKIVEYRVNSEANFDGVWHVEGMSHENILATGLCIVNRDRNFSGAEIEFRRFLFEDEGNDLMYTTPQNAYSPIDKMGGGYVRPLGRMKTPARRAIVFPNSHIHQLSGMHSSDGNEAIRRIVVFWLVNPDRPIISTENVPPQQGVISSEDAKRFRLALMAERKVHKEDYSDREVSLCEH